MLVRFNPFSLLPQAASLASRDAFGAYQLSFCSQSKSFRLASLAEQGTALCQWHMIVAKNEQS